MNPEKLLGNLLLGGMGKNTGFGLGTKTALGLGILGVAAAAFDHYMEQRQPLSPAPAVPGAGTPPPPPDVTSPSPPPPPQASAVPPAGPDRPAALTPGTADSRREAVLLIRAMIAAANADHAIDADERRRILERLEAAGLTTDERQFITNEFLAPAGMDAIVDPVDSPRLAQQVYAVSRLSIQLDTEAERAYLSQLAQRLFLNEAAVKRIHEELGVESTSQS